MACRPASTESPWLRQSAACRLLGCGKPAFRRMVAAGLVHTCRLPTTPWDEYSREDVLRVAREAESLGAQPGTLEASDQ